MPQSREIVRNNETASIHQNTPIESLSDDVLSYIFYLNTHMSYRTERKDPIFRTLLRCSHVSSFWRQIIVTSPTLWARVINLIFLRKSEWRKEVMNRTGRAPLSITADVQSPIRLSLWTKYDRMDEDDNYDEADSDLDDHEFVDAEVIISLLEKNWLRIRYIDVFISRNSESTEDWSSIEDRVWQLLKQRPSPMMGTFRFKIPSLSGGYDSEGVEVAPRDLKLLDDQAPRLFNLDPPTTINFKASWLCHIRDLSLRGPLPVDELLRALSSMPLLETLHDERNSITPRSGSTQLPMVSLPSLKEIVIRCGLAALHPYADLLNHISISQSTFTRNRLEFLIDPPDDVAWDLLEWPNFDSVQKILESFSICGLRRDADVHVHISRSHFSFNAVVSSYGVLRFIVDLDIIDVLPRAHTEDLLVALTKFVSLHDIQQLHLRVSDDAAIISSNDKVIPDWLYSISSVTVLDIHPNTFRFLAKHIPALQLPQLHTVNLESCPAVSDVPFIKKVLISFFGPRAFSKTLCIKMISFNRARSVADMRWVKKLVGLKVIFSSGGRGEDIEYICGGHDKRNLSKLPFYHY